TMDWDPLNEPFPGSDVMLSDIWPSEQEVAETVEKAVQQDMFTKSYAEVFEGDERWQGLDIPTGDRFEWAEDSTYVRKAPYFEGMPAEPEDLTDIEGARVLAKLGDSVTTDHISPAGSIKKDSPAGKYLQEHGVEPREFNSYGSRRGNHEVMIRGTFANIRLRNQLAPGTEGGVTRYLGDGGEGEEMSIYDAAQKYASEGTPLIILGGKEYGSGSSRDWAAKGTKLLGVRAVIANSFERIHRSNLVGMGVLPLQVEDYDLTGEEEISIEGFAEALNNGELPREVTVKAGDKELTARVRIDTPKEAEYFRHGGILPYVLRSLRDA
ncbi:MAG TPA: aconitate hydratase, partial [Solirubrobacteraceae bacterium]|nr:aconitate hydratase [Solirubrobacteraceae bacterium]